MASRRSRTASLLHSLLGHFIGRLAVTFLLYNNSAGLGRLWSIGVARRHNRAISWSILLDFALRRVFWWSSHSALHSLLTVGSLTKMSHVESPKMMRILWRCRSSSWARCHLLLAPGFHVHWWRFSGVCVLWLCWCNSLGTVVARLGTLSNNLLPADSLNLCHPDETEPFQALAIASQGSRVAEGFLPVVSPGTAGTCDRIPQGARCLDQCHARIHRSWLLVCTSQHPGVLRASLEDVSLL